MIKEDTGTGDMAAFTPAVGARACRGLNCFDIEDAHEFHSFYKGVKRFHQWKKHTKSENVRQWARANPGKDFYVSHAGNYMLVKRGKSLKESLCVTFDESDIALLSEAIDYTDRDKYLQSLKDITKKVVDYHNTNDWGRFYAFVDVMKTALTKGKELLDDKVQTVVAGLEAAKWKDAKVVQVAHYIAREYKG